MKFQFVGPAYTSRSVNENAQRCVNLYPEIDESGKNVVALYGVPGLKLQVTVGDGPIRGVLKAQDTLYVVSGSGLYEVTGSFNASLVGAVKGTSPVSMAANRTQLMVISEGTGYIRTLASNAFVKITDADFPSSPTFVVFLDSYFVVNDSGSDQFYISTLEDGTSWAALDFASAEGDPDDIVSMISDHRELWLFGEKTTEVWYNSGNADFPFVRLSGAFIEHGCAAAFSTQKMDNSVYWLGLDDKGQGMVFRAQGYSPQRISTHAIEKAIQGYSKIDDAVAYSYQQEGHSFYVIGFPTADKTWAYDASTNMWHERASFDNGQFKRHRAGCHAFFGGKNVVGDVENGNLYSYDFDTYTENGDAQVALRSCTHIHDGQDLQKIQHHRLQLDLQEGVGIVTGQGSDPQMMLRWSDDGGHTWSNEHWTSIGKIGKYGTRAVWKRLGASRSRVYEASITDPVKRVIIAGHLRMSQGNS